MNDDSYHVDIPDAILKKWQAILDDLAEKANIPCATITRVDYPEIEGFLTSNSPGNPATSGDRSLIAGTYCEHVIKADKEMLIPNALKIPEWEDNPDIEYGLIAYLGFPLRYPDKRAFGTVCILDTKENNFNEASRDLLIKYQKEIESDLKTLECE
jgi:GAF domain-containing protein